MRDPEVSAPAFVGRERELATIQRALRRPHYPGYRAGGATVDVGEADLVRDLSLAADRCDTAPGYAYDAEIAILGDHEGRLTRLLDQHDFHGTDVTWEDDLTGYDAVIVNRPGSPGGGCVPAVPGRHRRRRHRGGVPRLLLQLGQRHLAAAPVSRQPE